MPPDEADRKAEVLWLAKKWVYGLRKAPRGFNAYFTEVAKEAGWKRIAAEPQLYFHTKIPGAMMSVHTDDLLLSAREGQSIKAELGKQLTVKWE